MFKVPLLGGGFARACHVAATLQLTVGPQNVGAASALKLDNVSCTSVSSYPTVMFGNE